MSDCEVAAMENLMSQPLPGDDECQVKPQVRDAPFPMLNGPPIDWGLAEKIYKVYSKLYGTIQTLEYIAKRGGFGWGEVPHIWEEHQRKYGAP